MTARILQSCLVMISLAAAVAAQPVLQHVGTVATPLPMEWSDWGDLSVAVTDLDARLITWPNAEASRTRVLFDLPAPPTLVDVWGDSVLVQVPGEGGRLIINGADELEEWVAQPANWRLPNVAVDGEDYRIFIDPLLYMIIYSAPGPGGIQSLFDFIGTIGTVDQWHWDGDRVLLGNASGVHIVDISNPLVPFVIGTIDPPQVGWTPRELFVRGRTAYVQWGDRIAIYDVENPGTPPMVSQFSSLDPQFTVSDRWLVSWGRDEARHTATIVDIVDPENISTRGSFMTAGELIDARINISGNFVQISHPLGLSLHEIPAGMAPPIDRGYAWTVMDAWLMATAGQTAWLQRHDQRYVVNLTSKAVVNVQERSDAVATGSLAVHDEVLFDSSGGGHGLRIESLADPRDPQVLNLLDPTPGLEGIDVAGDLLAAADGAGLVIYDVSDPGAPAMRGDLELPGGTRRVLIAGDTAVVTSYREFDSDLIHVVDIADPDAPQLVESFAVETAEFPSVWYRAYQLVRRDDGVHVMLAGTNMVGAPTSSTAFVDLAVPNNPQLSFVEASDDFWCFEYRDPSGMGEALFATLDLPVTIGDYHVSFRADTVSVYTYDGAADQLTRQTTWIAPDQIETIAAAGNKLLVYANHRLDMLTLSDAAVVDVPDIVTAATVRAIPNPFNPQTEISFTMPRDGTARVEIYDVRGAQVRRIDASLASGPARITWRGADQGGRALPSGTYLLRVHVPGSLLSGRCQLIR